MSWPRVQDRGILAALLTSLVLLAWWVLLAGEQAPWGHALLHPGHAAQLGLAPLPFAALFVLGWTLMTIAMMLPTSAPLILLFHRMLAGRPRAAGLVALLVAGYLGLWAAFGLVVHVLHRGVQAGVGEVPWLIGNGWALGAAIFLGAGLYQFSPLKYACLDKCRTPMAFLVQRWRGKHAAREAFRLGVEHAIFCIGCCWSLMLVMFAVSAGSLACMLVLGATMAAEKNLPWGRRLSAPVGVVLIVLAAVVAARRV